MIPLAPAYLWTLERRLLPDDTQAVAKDSLTQLWEGEVELGGPGIWVGERLIRFLRRRRRKVKVQVFRRKRPEVCYEDGGDGELELVDEVEIEQEPGASIPAG